MRLPLSLRLILPLLVLQVHAQAPSRSRRAKKASRALLANINKLINDDVQRVQATIQSDPGFFTELKRPANAARHHDELAVNDPEGYFQGDMDLSEQQALRIANELRRSRSSPGGSSRVKRKVGREPFFLRWDAGKPISFDFAESIPDETRIVIRDAMKIWQAKTCIRFEENGPNVDRLEFFDGGGCSSFVGKVGGTQGISIATPGCDVVGIISHEIGHSLGIFHEQARPDQDRNIAVNYNNIPIGRWNNFQPVTDDQANTYALPYDTGSVMHYGAYGFASDPYVPTIRTLDRTQQFTIGQRTGPSFLDFQAVRCLEKSESLQINTAYDCGAPCAPLHCMHNGYPNPNECTQCLCPDGFAGKHCQHVQPSVCGETIHVTRNSRSISSPSHPNNFPEGSECYWLLKAPKGGKVYLEFSGDFEFMCEDTCDKSFVEVKFKTDFRLTGSRYCCATRPMKRFESETDEMIVIFKGQGGVSKGFEALVWSNQGEFIEPTTTPAPVIPVRVSPIVPLPLETTDEPVDELGEIELGELPLMPNQVTLPPPPTTPNTPSPPDSILKSDCGCGEWSEWVGECTQECGGCGKRTRTRKCEQKKDCQEEEKRMCNTKVCPPNTNFLINNAEFHILWKGCCVGLFRSGGECTALENGQNPFLRIISTLLGPQDPLPNEAKARRRARVHGQKLRRIRRLRKVRKWRHGQKH